MKILLISANTFTSPYPIYPLGLIHVASALNGRHRVKILDMNLTGIDAIGRSITDFQPDAVGISLRNIDNTDITEPVSFMDEYRVLVDVVRQYCDAPIILGGAGYSILPNEILEAVSADFGIVGDGNRITALLDALENKQPVASLPGVVTPDGNIGEQHLPASPPSSPDFKPPADILKFYQRKGGMLNLQTKRGCPFRCIYCTYPQIEGGRLRLIPPAEVARTAKALEQAGAGYLFLADSAFNADIAHSLEVADQFRQAGLRIPWGAFLAPIEMPQDYYEKLAAAGLTHIEFGTESLCNRVLEAYRKPFTRGQVLENHQRALEAGLHVAHYFLMGGPGETPETLEVTLSHIEKLLRCVLFLFCGMRIYPQTGLYERALAEKLITASHNFLNPVFYHTPRIMPDEIIARVKSASGNRRNWLVGSVDDQGLDLLDRMYAKGYKGPLWEYLIQ